MHMIKHLILAVVLALAGVVTAHASETVNINTADAATLDRVLTNVGPAKAQAIVEYRRSNGAFRSVEQLALVRGIGPRTVEANRDRITLGAAPARAVANPPRGRRIALP